MKTDISGNLVTINLDEAIAVASFAVGKTLNSVIQISDELRNQYIESERKRGAGKEDSRVSTISADHLKVNAEALINSIQIYNALCAAKTRPEVKIG